MAGRRISAQFLTILQRSSIGSRSSPSLETVSVPWQGRLFSNRGLHSEAQAKDDNEETRDYESGKMVNEGGGRGSVDVSFAKKSDEVKQKQAQSEGVAKDAVSASSEKVDEVKGKVKETTEDTVSASSQKIDEAKGKVKETTEDAVSASSQKVDEAKGKVKETTEDVVSASSQKVDEAKGKVKETKENVEGKAAEVTDQAKGQVAKNVDTAKEMFKDVPQKVSETATGLKEVGVEAGKAVKRDAEKLVQKVGLKTE